MKEWQCCTESKKAASPLGKNPLDYLELVGTWKTANAGTSGLLDTLGDGTFKIRAGPWRRCLVYAAVHPSLHLHSTSAPKYVGGRTGYFSTSRLLL